MRCPRNGVNFTQRLQFFQCLRPGFRHAREVFGDVLVDSELRSLRCCREGVVLVGRRPSADGFATRVFNAVVGDVAEVPDREELVRPVLGNLRDHSVPLRCQEAHSLTLLPRSFEVQAVAEGRRPLLVALGSDQRLVDLGCRCGNVDRPLKSLERRHGWLHCVAEEVPQGYDVPARQDSTTAREGEPGLGAETVLSDANGRYGRRCVAASRSRHIGG